MATMIERVAKAMFCATTAYKTSSVPLVFGTPFPPEEFCRMARAAIEAMRDPTLNMHNAGALGPHQAKSPTLSILESGTLIVDWRGAEPSGIWRDMIDAALSENCEPEQERV